MVKEIAGVTFAVPYQFMKRFFDEGKTVFIKNSKFKQIRPGMKLVFYASVEVKSFVGDGIIEKVEFLTPNEVVNKYKKELFLTKEECFQYANQISGHKKYKVSKFLTLTLKNITRYSKPVKPQRFISVGGRYMSKAEYENILSKAKA